MCQDTSKEGLPPACRSLATAAIEGSVRRHPLGQDILSMNKLSASQWHLDDVSQEQHLK